MGYEKLISLAERCARYAKACGKRSILETKPVGKVDFSKLGVCLSDGTIRFQSEEAALEYAKNVSIQSLKLPISKQFERGVATEGCDVLEVLNGTHGNISFYDSKVFNFQSCQRDFYKPRTKVYSHSHPSLDKFGNTMPISPGDVVGDTALFGQSNVRKIIAYNMKGQHSTVEILPSFSQDLNSQFCKKYIDFMIRKFLPKEKVARYYELKEIEFKYLLGEGESLTEELYAEYLPLKDEVMRLFDEPFLKKHFKECARYTHEFWVENAEKYGMKYTTDMRF